ALALVAEKKPANEESVDKRTPHDYYDDDYYEDDYKKKHYKRHDYYKKKDYYDDDYEDKYNRHKQLFYLEFITEKIKARTEILLIPAKKLKVLDYNARRTQ
ncbi:181_t:CDS:2, partial [Funneliformis geosporum]